MAIFHLRSLFDATWIIGGCFIKCSQWKCIHRCAHIFYDSFTHTHTHTFIWKHTHIYMKTHTYKHTHIHTFTSHAHTHTTTQTRTLTHSTVGNNLFFDKLSALNLKAFWFEEGKIFQQLFENKRFKFFRRYLLFDLMHLVFWRVLETILTWKHLIVKAAVLQCFWVMVI